MPRVTSPTRALAPPVRYVRASSADAVYGRRERKLDAEMERDRDPDRGTVPAVERERRDRDRDLDREPARFVERERERPARDRDGRDYSRRVPRPYYEDYIESHSDDSTSDEIQMSDAGSVAGRRPAPRRYPSPPQRVRREASPDAVRHREAGADRRRRASPYRPWRRSEALREIRGRRDPERDRHKRRTRAPRIPNFFDDEDDDFTPQFYGRDSHLRRPHGNGAAQYVVPPPGMPSHTRERGPHGPEPYPDYQQYPSRPVNGYAMAPGMAYPMYDQYAPPLNMPYPGTATTLFNNPFPQYPQPGPPDLNAYPRERVVMPQMPMPGPPDLNAYPRERSMPHQQPMSMPPDLNAYPRERNMAHQPPISVPLNLNAYYPERSTAQPPPMPMSGPPNMNSYPHERAMSYPQPPPPDPPRPPPAREAAYTEPRGYSSSYEAERTTRETAEAEKQKGLVDSIRREVDSSLEKAALDQKARGEMMDTWARKETERRLEFQDQMRQEIEQSFANAAEAQRQRNENTENWARKEVERRKLFEEMIQAEVVSATRATKTIDEESSAKEEEAQRLRALAEDLMQKSQQALEEARRLIMRNDFETIEVVREERGSPAPPPPPVSPPSSSNDYHRGRRLSRSPPWAPTSSMPEVPKPPETEAEEGEEAEKDDESEIRSRRRRSTRRGYSSSAGSPRSFSSVSSCEKEEIQRRELRRIREELLDPILDRIGGLTTAVMHGGLHFNAPPVFMHYPTQTQASETSRSFSSCSESDDRETVTPMQEEPVQRGETEQEQEQELGSEVRAVVTVPDLDEQELSSAKIPPSGTSGEQPISAENGSSGGESWTTATEDVVGESTPPVQLTPAKHMVEVQDLLEKEDDTDEAPTLVNFESAGHTAVETKTLFQTEQQTVDNEVIESYPKESSDQPRKDILAPTNDPDVESEDVETHKPHPSTSDKRTKNNKAGDSRHRHWDGSYAPKMRFSADFERLDTTTMPNLDRRGRAGYQGRKGRHGYEKMSSMPRFQPAFIPIPYFHPVFRGASPSGSRRRRDGDDEPMVD
ncbi:hypothetical protein B0J13DRAFT_152033 [Dactylonectria estremocensis]|uniref:Uncharacterized protein n=1 Tax=Dactylonectria estremocensis TaxID=1079267 RepID=A0A9P9IL23_9HYPO|nr:hypothetical protein B0J13DRAFT_152033 [Dactylonectria estremocensis]